MGETPALELLPCRMSKKPISNCANLSHVVNFEWHIHERGGLVPYSSALLATIPLPVRPLDDKRRRLELVQSAGGWGDASSAPPRGRGRVCCAGPRCNVDASPEARALHRRTADKFGRVRMEAAALFLASVK
jgi:hypothetical protein